MGFCLLLTACGTDILDLVREDSRLTWDAHLLSLAAADLDHGIEDALYDAELEKIEVCAPLNTRVQEEILRRHRASFGKRFVSDLKRLFILIVPVGWIERCAQAHKAFERQFLDLRQRLEGRGARAFPPQD